MFRVVLSGLLALLLSACSFPGVYKVPIQQGNIIEQEMLDQLEVGMTERQVAYVLGNPLIKDSFNKNRWDYLYQLERGDEILNRYHIAVYFKDGLYTHFTGKLPKDVQEVIDPEKGKKLREKARDHK